MQQSAFLIIFCTLADSLPILPRRNELQKRSLTSVITDAAQAATDDAIKVVIPPSGHVGIPSMKHPNLPKTTYSRFCKRSPTGLCLSPNQPRHEADIPEEFRNMQTVGVFSMDDVQDLKGIQDLGDIRDIWNTPGNHKLPADPIVPGATTPVKHVPRSKMRPKIKQPRAQARTGRMPIRHLLDSLEVSKIN